MSELHIPAKKEIKGPWFIGQLELEELDTIFENISANLLKSLNIEIDSEVKIEFEKKQEKSIEEIRKTIQKSYLFEKKVKKVSLISVDNRKLVDSTIKGVLKDSKVNDFNTYKLNLNIELGYHNEFSFELSRSFDGELKYNANCFDQNSKDDIKYEIEKWIEKYKPNKAKQIWSEFWFAFLLFSLFAIPFSWLALKNSDVIPIDKGEIDKIISIGVSKENEYKAIELLLKFAANSISKENPTSKVLFDKSVIKFDIILLIISIVSFFRPRTIIGIGKSKLKLKFFKTYTNFILITIPALFIIPPLIEIIKQLFNL